MKTYREDIAPSFSASILDGREWLVSRPGRFTSGTHYIGELVGPQKQNESCGEKKSLAPAGNGSPILPLSNP
jgi:hypothetical protein